MTCYTFQLMPSAFQLVWVLAKGTYLAYRWGQQGCVNLYHLSDGGRGFFAEVSYNKATQTAEVLRSFVSSVPLGDYAQGVRLPEE
jgi:hypothetical protein